MFHEESIIEGARWAARRMRRKVIDFYEFDELVNIAVIGIIRRLRRRTTYPASLFVSEVLLAQQYGARAIHLECIEKRNRLKRRAPRRPLSIDREFEDWEFPITHDERRTSSWRQRERIESLLDAANVTSRQRQVIELRMQGASWREVAETVGHATDAPSYCASVAAVKRIRRHLGLDPDAPIDWLNTTGPALKRRAKQREAELAATAD